MGDPSSGRSGDEALFEDEKFRDHCGLVALAADFPVASHIFYALQSLQHRGQESAGITTLDGRFEFRTHKAMGLVDQVFNPETIKKLRGSVGIGHVRYSTSAGSTEENAQPQVVMSGQGGIALGHNGNIPNTEDLREELQSKGWAFYTGNDTEVVVRLLANKLIKHEGDKVAAITDTMRRLDGAYCFVLLMGEELFAVRDPLGIKPLCMGELPSGKGFMVASESVALDVAGATLVRDIRPGEVVRITKKGVETVAHLPAAEPAHCFFEFVYFARPDSIMDGRLNQDSRARIRRRGRRRRARAGLRPQPRAGLRRRERHPVRRGADEEPLRAPDLHHADAGRARVECAPQTQPRALAPEGQARRAHR
jgi:amidophosphoribosyltransferase